MMRKYKVNNARRMYFIIFWPGLTENFKRVEDRVGKVPWSPRNEAHTQESCNETDQDIDTVFSLSKWASVNSSGAGSCTPKPITKRKCAPKMFFSFTERQKSTITTERVYDSAMLRTRNIINKEQ